MERLLAEQQDVIRSIERTIDNYKKMGVKLRTPAITRSRLTILKERWTQCQTLNADIKTVATTEQRSALPYFVEDDFSAAEENYLEAADFLAQALDEMEKPVTTYAHNINSSTTSECNPVAIPLPRINLPKFSGQYTEWTNFRDLFQSLVASNESLSNVQRLHYLKASLTGEAGLVIKNISITDANYRTAWSELQRRYDNLRAIVTAHLNSILDLPSMKSESASELKRVYDTINDALHALRNIGRRVDDDFVVAIAVRKLDPRTLREWEIQLGGANDPPLYSTLSEFLVGKMRALEAISDVRNDSNSKNHRTGTTKSLVSNVSRNKCIACQEPHAPYQCDKFKSFSVDQRKTLVKTQRCCYNCLGKGHFPSTCPSQRRCTHCQGKHHSLLHAENEPNSSKERPEVSKANDKSDVPVSDPKSTIVLKVQIDKGSNPITTPVLLATARVLVSTNEGRALQMRALIDTGSEATFITERAAQALHSKRQKTKVRVTGLGGRCSNVANYRTFLTLGSCGSEFYRVNTRALILPILTSYKQLPKVDHKLFPHLRDLPLADADPSNQDRIDLLIGADIYGSILLEGLRKGSETEPVAQRTIFGWVIFGPYNSMPRNVDQTTSLHATVSPSVDEELRKFWELEEIPFSRPLTEEEEYCENLFVSSHYRRPDGRYVVRLPFKRDAETEFGNSLQIAVKSLMRSETRLSRDPALYEAYNRFLTEYEQLGHMARILPSDQVSSSTFYMPHHPVLREDNSTTPLRVVFNASSPTNVGFSLNDQLLAGPKLQEDLPSILLRWRTHRYVFIADIAKMFRQILVHPSDTDYQRIVWRPGPNDPMEHYRLLTVTYGQKPSPYLAKRSVKQLCLDEGAKFPLAVLALEESTYVDDALFGAYKQSQILEIRDQLNNLLKLGGFQLRKWASSHEELLDDVPMSDRLDLSSVSFQEDASIKALGLSWNPSNDSFSFSLKFCKPKEASKRSVLSIISRIFDPLGLIAPVVVSAKIFLQELWMRRLDWDTPFLTDLLEWWDKYYGGLQHLREISIPRWTTQGPEVLGLELHGFSDASSRAYAAVVYIRVLTSMDQFDVTLLICKTKVAPIKTVSIPRLELCAAALLARLVKFVQAALKLQSVPVYCWSDSMSILAWLRQHPSIWKTFVANRVSDIQTRLPLAKWGYVESRLNPADCASRGVEATTLKGNQLWWKGPPWLSQHSTSWPEHSPATPAETIPERRSVQVLTVKRESLEWDFPTEISSWPRLLRITAYCMIFSYNLRKRVGASSVISKGETFSLADAIRRARSFWITKVQDLHFAAEIKTLKLSKPLLQSNSLKSLTPFIDSDGLLRVGGRLEYAPFSFEERHPIILPRHRISDLIAEQAHKRCLHGGTQLTLRTIRQQFWIITARKLVKSLIRHCVVCVRQRANPVTQLMGSLPKPRVTPARPFQHCGVDYAGPFKILSKVGRGQRAYKAYIALFVCLSTRAIHLELVNDYSSGAFLATLKRFSARRGLPSVLYSDNGTNFHGADRELARAFKVLSRDANLQAHLATDNVIWKFIPPSAPHFGGLWEAGVKSVKHHLKRIMGSHTPSAEEFATLLTLIEACLNSRPIAALSDDPNDLSSLTPGHFLIGGPLISVPEESVLDLSEGRLDRWQRVRRVQERFWKVWSTDYLHTLQQRTKWQQSCANLAKDELVIVRNELLPPTKWELGRIQKLYPDQDGRVRVVDVKTVSGIYKRPITKLCRLPLSHKESQRSE